MAIFSISDKKYSKLLKLIDEKKITLEGVAKKYRTKELVLLAIKRSTSNIQFLDKHEQTKEICELAVQLDGESVQYIHKQTPEVCYYAIDQLPRSIEFIQHNVLKEDMIIDAVNQNGLLLGLVDPKFQTMNVCKAAVKQNGAALQFAKDEFMTTELVETAILSNFRRDPVLKFVPKSLVTPEISKLAVSKDKRSLKYLN